MSKERRQAYALEVAVQVGAAHSLEQRQAELERIAARRLELELDLERLDILAAGHRLGRCALPKRTKSLEVHK